jgi:uncharacterized protein (TIGR03437 family)
MLDLPKRRQEGSTNIQELLMRTFCAAIFFVCTLGLQAQVAVVNGASNRPEQPVAAGSWATAYGTFAGVTTTASALPFPSTLGGVSVSIAGSNAPVYFVSSGQINFLIPYTTTPGLKTVTITTPAGPLNGNLRVMTSAPGLFVKDQQQHPKGAILNQTSAENTQSTPARRGEVIQIYATGPGALSSAPVDGGAAPSSPLITTTATPQVFIGGVEAQVQFSGLAPGFAGLWQINAVVPDRAFVSGRVPVNVLMNGVDSNEVGLFVQPKLCSFPGARVQR